MGEAVRQGRKPSSALRSLLSGGTRSSSSGQQLLLSPHHLSPPPTSSSTTSTVLTSDNTSTSTFNSAPSGSPQSSSSSKSSISISSSSGAAALLSPSLPLHPTTHLKALPQTLPPLPPPPPEDSDNIDFSKRPSTAPDSSLTSSSNELKGFDNSTGSSKDTNSKSRRSVRKAPTLANLSDLTPRSRKTSAGSASRSVISLGSHPLSPPAPRTSSRERRPSSSRRPPASFSANGIETSFGPPPSLITRSSSYHSELARRVQNPAASAFTAAQQQSQSRGVPAEAASQVFEPESSPQSVEENKLLLASSGTVKKRRENMNSLDAVVRDRPSSRDWQHNQLPNHPYGSRETSSHGVYRQPPFQKSDESMESSQSSEDLFLKLAEGGTEEDLTLRDEQMRGRESSQYSAGLNVEPRNYRRNSSPAESAFSSRYHQQDHLSLPRRRGSNAGTSMVSAASNHRRPSQAEQKLNAYRHKYLASATPPSAPPSQHGIAGSAPMPRRASATEQLVRAQTARSSRLNNFLSEYSPRATRSSYHAPPDAADSVVSTVQSAVWDDIPAEAKSALAHHQQHPRQFQSTGGGTSERPRTATTTITTVSSSPKFPMGLKSTLVEGKLLPQQDPALHPILHQSLARCKQHVNASLYRSLEKAANDALDLAAYSRIPASPTGPVADRALRRKADNLCRNLTDLCISLAEASAPNVSPDASVVGNTAGPKSASSLYQHGTAGATRPLSRDQYAGFGAGGVTNSPLELKAAQTFGQQQHPQQAASVVSSGSGGLYPRQSNLLTAEGGAEKPTASRALDRVEARRASLMLAGGTSSGSLPGTPLTPSGTFAPAQAPGSRHSQLYTSDTVMKSSPAGSATLAAPQQSGVGGLLSRAGTSLSLLKTRSANRAGAQTSQGGGLSTPLHSNAYDRHLLHQQQQGERNAESDGLRPPSRATTDVGYFALNSQGRRRSERFSAGYFTRRNTNKDEDAMSAYGTPTSANYPSQQQAVQTPNSAGPNMLRRVTQLGRERDRAGFSSPIVSTRRDELTPTAPGSAGPEFDEKQIKRRSFGLYSVGNSGGLGRSLSIGSRHGASSSVGGNISVSGLGVNRSGLKAGVE